MENVEWWMPKYEFFGDFYIEGDNSLRGYRQGVKQTLSERVQTEVDGIVKLLGLQGNEKILDLPCGYGRHSIELASRGFSVVGCDINETHLENATKASHKRDIDMHFLLGNMLDFKLNYQFNAVINMFYSFGFFKDEQDNINTLRNFYENLVSGGQFLFHTDVNLGRVLSGKYPEVEERKLSSGKTLEIIDKYDPLSKRMNGQWIIKDDNRRVIKSYSVRIYSDLDFIEACKMVGFTDMKVFGDWDGSPFTEDSEDMIVIAKK